MALVVGFTFIETKGLTLEQIDQVFNGTPRSEILDVIEAYDGNQPISDKDLRVNVTEVPGEKVAGQKA
jgi:hypothetical protein